MPGIEYFGTAMSVIVAISLLQKNIKWLRILNLFGALGFAFYGFIIHAWPVLGLNSFIALADLYYLIGMLRRQDQFSHFFTDPGTDPYCRQFMEYYGQDLRKYHPGLPDQFQPGDRACVILRNMVPVSLILFRPVSRNRVEILADYATPAYRDFKSSAYFLKNVVAHEELSEVSELASVAVSSSHEKYLRRMGYRPKGKQGLFIWKYE